MDLLPDPLAAPGPEVMIDGTPRWQIMGQQFPRAAAANGIADPIHNLAPGVLGRTPAGFGGGHERLQAIPFRLSEISIVGLAVFHLDRLRGRLFKRALSLRTTARQEGKNRGRLHFWHCAPTWRL